MKRSSVILLWVSLVGSLGESIYMLGSLITHFLVFRPAILAWRSQVEAESDIASVVVFHVSAAFLIAFVPPIVWFFVRLTDRYAVTSRLGRVATWSCLLYLVIVTATVLWSESTITS